MTRFIGPHGKKGLEALEELARNLFGNDDIEIDPLKKNQISCGDNGIWVRAWVHVDNEALAQAGIRNPESTE